MHQDVDDEHEISTTTKTTTTTTVKNDSNNNRIEKSANQIKQDSEVKSSQVKLNQLSQEMKKERRKYSHIVCRDTLAPLYIPPPNTHTLLHLESTDGLLKIQHTFILPSIHQSVIHPSIERTPIVVLEWGMDHTSRHMVALTHWSSNSCYCWLKYHQ